jgi:predicted ribosomally synthesized peptide with SipW-like signal peptide
MIRTQKKKSLTLVLAIALVVVLAVAGTLMLFTAKSKTATNVFTVGNIQAALEEAGGTYNEEDGKVTINEADYYTIGEAITQNQKLDLGYTYDDNNHFTGIQTAGHMPGDVVVKAPRVKNTGAKTGFYTAVYAKTTFQQNGEELSIASVGAIARASIEGEATTDLQKIIVLLKEVFEDTEKEDGGAGWCISPVDYNEDADDGDPVEFYSGWYYVNKGGTFDNGLKELIGKGQATPPMFETLTLPVELTGAEGLSIKMELRAVALQSANVTSPQSADSEADGYAEHNAYGAIKALFEKNGLTIENAFPAEE